MKPILFFCLLMIAIGASPVAAPADDFDDAQQVFRAGDYERCIEMCEEAIFELAHRQDWPILKIKAELTLGRFADAVMTFEEGLYTHPNSIRLLMIGIEAYRYVGDDVRVVELQFEIQQLYDRNNWRYRDGVNQVAIGEYLLSRGADAKLVLDQFFQRIKANQPALIEPYLAIANLGLAKNDYALAADNFRKALELEGDNPDAMFGLAEALAPSDRQAAGTWIEKALAVNPRHVPSLLTLVDFQINAELYDEAEKFLENVLEINSHQFEAWAYKAAIAHLQNQRQQESDFRNRALEHWASNPTVDHLIGKKLSQKYRFKEAALYQQRALMLDPNYQPAKIQLAQDQLRLGNDRLGWRLADEVHQQDAYNVAAYNLVTLRDQMEAYETIESNMFVVRMDPLEAKLYGAMVIELLQQAAELLTEKYNLKIEQPVTIEIFSRQQDFAIRTFGTPGGDGFLGVCFGNLITMNSPAAQQTRLTSWQSVLWHEFCHVVTLQKTENKMPRWLSEGISVYEERLANPAWGQSMTPVFRTMILSDEDLTPVSQLSSAFLRPKSGMHLQFAYFQSSLVVEYLIDMYGIETVRRILDDLRVGMPINESLARYTGSIELLDREFTEYVRDLANRLLADVDLTDPELPPNATLELVAQYIEAHPTNLPAMRRYAALLIAADRWEQAAEACQALIEVGDNFPGADNPYRLLAGIHAQTGNQIQEQQALENYLAVDVNALEPLTRLMEIARASEDWRKLEDYANLFVAVNPLIPTAHRYLADVSLATNDDDLAIRSLQALLELDPLDPAETHFQLASAYFRQGDVARAKRFVLKSIEEAPRYRAAYELLQMISAQETKPNHETGELSSLNSR